MADKNKITFLNGWKINIDKLPEYTDFKKSFTEITDKNLMIALGEDSRIHESQRDLLKELIKQVKHSNNLYVKHTQLVKSGKIKIGRFYPDGNVSLIPLCKKIKHTIFKHLGIIDFDMVRGHPSIAYNLGKQNGVVFENMKKYIEQREEIVKEISEYYSDDVAISEGEVKDLFNLLIYGGGFQTWVKELNEGSPQKDRLPKKVANKPLYSFVEKFIKERDSLMDLIYIHNKELYDLIFVSRPELTKSQELHKNKRSLTSYYLQAIENHILYIAFKFLQKKGIIKKNNVFLEYDGLCVPYTEFNHEQAISDLNNEIINKTGMAVCFAIKGHAYALDDLINDVKQVDNSIRVVDNDKEASDILYEELKEDLVYCENNYYYRHENIWISDEKSIRSLIRSYVMNSNIYKRGDGDDKNVLEYSSNYSSASQITHCILDLAVCNTNNNWLRNGQLSSLGKILFDNGYYDFRNEKFYSNESDEFDKSIIFMGKIHHSFAHFSDDDMAYMHEIKNKMFYQTLGEDVGNYFIENLARGLAGDLMKKIFFGLGGTNTGKSKLTTAIKLSFGDYFGSFNGENLTYRNTSQDEAAQMRWCMLLKYKRVIISNELRTTSEISGNMVKKLSSGGDTLIGRGHCESECEFIPHFLPIVFANDISKITPFDDATRLRTNFISYDKQFVDEPTNEFELKKDDNIDNEIRTLRFQRCFIGMLILEHLEFKERGELEQPSKVAKAKEDWTGETNDIIKCFTNRFNVNNDPNSYIENSAIEYWIKENNLGISLCKLSKELKKYAKIKKLNNVDQKVKKINSVSKRVWFGISNTFTTIEDDDTDEEIDP